MYLYSIPSYVESLIKADEKTGWANAKEYNPNENWNNW